MRFSSRGGDASIFTRPSFLPRLRQLASLRITKLSLCAKFSLACRLVFSMYRSHTACPPSVRFVLAATTAVVFLGLACERSGLEGRPDAGVASTVTSGAGGAAGMGPYSGISGSGGLVLLSGPGGSGGTLSGTPGGSGGTAILVSDAGLLDSSACPTPPNGSNDPDAGITPCPCLTEDGNVASGSACSQIGLDCYYGAFLCGGSCICEPTFGTPAAIWVCGGGLCY
jgi:hypothetical protein